MLEFMQYIALLIFPLRNLGMTVAFGQRAAAALLRVDEVLSTDVGVDDPAQPASLPDRQPNGEVRFRDVRFGYSPDQAGPRRLRPDHRSRAAPSRSSAPRAAASRRSPGCSTRFYDVEEGGIEIDGVDIRDLRLSELRHAVSIVFEDTFLFNDTVTGNIAFARPDAAPEDVERAARLAGAHDFITALPRRLRDQHRRAGLLAVAVGNASASRSRERSSPTHACSCSTTRRAPSTRRRSTRSARRWRR